MALSITIASGGSLSAQQPTGISVASPKVDAAWFGENQNLPEVENLKRPQLDLNSKTFTDWTFTQGHATYVLSGQAAYFRTGGELRGFYFQGKGRITYISNDPVEFGAIKYTAKRHSYLKPKLNGSAMALQENLDDGLFWFAGGPIPEIPGTASTMAVDKFSKRLNTFLEEDQTPFLHALALRQLKSTQEPYFRVQFQGPDHLWRHSVDGLDCETLSTRRARNSDWGFEFPWVKISSQPIGWSHKEPLKPRFLLTKVDVDLNVIKDCEAKFRVTETFVPTCEGMTALDLRLRNRLSGLTLGGTNRVQRIQVQSVKDGRGQAVPFDHSSEGILVSIPGLKLNVPVDLTFDITGEPIFFEFLDNHWDGWYLEGPWLPLPNNPAGENFTVHAVVNAPANVTPMLVGESIRRVKEGGRIIVESRTDHPIHNFTILANGLSTQEEKRGEFTLRTVGWGQVSLDRQLLDRTWPLVNNFQQLLGPFPFKELNVVVGRNGYETYPGVISAIRGPKGYGTEAIGKLLARQYWDQVIKPWNADDRWIAGAFSQFSIGFLFRLSGSESGKSAYDRIADEWFRRADLVRDLGAVAMMDRIVPKDGDVTELEFQTNLGMYKGACLLYRLREELGDKAMVDFLRAYLAQASFQPMSSAQIPVVLKKVTGKDYTAFFDQYLWGDAMPSRKP